MNLKNKKVLVTGACGFIGSHLVESLIEEGCRVKAFIWYNSFNRLGWLDHLPGESLKKVDVFSGDIRDAGNARDAVKGVDIVFHLAALVGIPFSYSSPESYVDTNIRGTLNILQASRDGGAKRVFVTSTSEVYGTAVRVPICEEHPKNSQSPYSASKTASDALARSFHDSFGLPVTIVRPFNTYGPRQSARAVIPAIITQLLSGSAKIRLGSLRPTRDLVYVKDTVAAFIEIARSDKTIGEEINIATGKEISIGELARILIKHINPDAGIIKDKERVRPAASEVERLIGSIKKIKRLTSWRVRYSLEEGLAETIDWFRKGNNLTLYKPDIYNV